MIMVNNDCDNDTDLILVDKVGKGRPYSLAKSSRKNARLQSITPTLAFSFRQVCGLSQSPSLGSWRSCEKLTNSKGGEKLEGRGWGRACP